MKFASGMRIEIMNINLYIVSIVLLAVWFLGFMILDLSNAIHFVFLCAILTFLYKLVKDFRQK